MEYLLRETWLLDIHYDYILGLLGFILLLNFVKQLTGDVIELQKQVLGFQNEIRAINSSNLGVARKINELSKDFAEIEHTKHIQQVEETATISEKTCQQAGLLLSRGATIEEVVDSCDIAPAEAELLAIMKHSAPSNSLSA